MSYSFNNTVVKNITFNGQKIKKWNHNGVQVYSSGNTVTYYVESSTKYTEEVNSGNSCLSPKSFTPTKSGYTFVGWREDKTASSSVLTTKTMGDDPITLYAVFKQTINLYTTSNGSKATNSQQRYYNNGNAVNPKFTVANPTRSGWSFKGWSTSASSTTASYTSISNLTLTATTNLYAVWNIADKTANISVATNGDDRFFEHTQNQATLLSGVDTSKYSAVTFTFSTIEIESYYRLTWLTANITDGTNKTSIGCAYVDGNGDGIQYPNQNIVKTPTLTFSSSSGTKNVSLQTTVTVYGSTTTTGTVGMVYAVATKYTLKGRTVVY